MDFNNAWENRVAVEMDLGNKKIPVYYLGLNSLIKNKSAIRRPKDLEDLKYLKEIKKMKNLNKTKKEKG